MMASAAPPSSFPSLIQNSFVPSIDTNLSLLDFESKFFGSFQKLDLFRGLEGFKLKPGIHAPLSPRAARYKLALEPTGSGAWIPG